MLAIGSERNLGAIRGTPLSERYGRDPAGFVVNGVKANRSGTRRLLSRLVARTGTERFEADDGTSFALEAKTGDSDTEIAFKLLTFAALAPATLKDEALRQALGMNPGGKGIPALDRRAMLASTQRFASADNGDGDSGLFSWLTEAVDVIVDVAEPALEVVGSFLGGGSGSAETSPSTPTAPGAPAPNFALRDAAKTGNVDFNIGRRAGGGGDGGGGYTFGHALSPTTKVLIAAGGVLGTVILMKVV